MAAGDGVGGRVGAAAGQRDDVVEGPGARVEFAEAVEVIDVFPPAQQEQVRIQLASALQGVVTQTLLPTADRAGRVACLEILIPDDAVRNLIRQGKVEQIYSVMQTSTQRGMQTMEHGLAELIRKGVVAGEVALAVSSRKEQLIGMLERSGVSVNFTAPDPTPASGLRIAGSG